MSWSRINRLVQIYEAVAQFEKEAEQMQLGEVILGYASIRAYFGYSSKHVNLYFFAPKMHVEIYLRTLSIYYEAFFFSLLMCPLILLN